MFTFNLLVVLLLAFGGFGSVNEVNASSSNGNSDIQVQIEESFNSARIKINDFFNILKVGEKGKGDKVKPATTSVSGKKSVKEKIKNVVNQKKPNKLGETTVVTFDYEDIGGNVHEMDVKFVLREWEVVDKESKEGTQWIKGHFVLAATVDGSDKHEGNLAFPTGVQPIYPAALNEEFINEKFFIHSSVGPKFDMYLDAISPGDVKSGRFELLVPAGDVTGSIIMINTGASQVWYEL